MNNNDKREFFDAMESAFEIYGKKPCDRVANLYWDSLIRFDLADVLRALSSHVQNPDTGQFLPKPADIIRILDGTTQSKAMVAWSKVHKAIRTVGPHSSVLFDDPLIHAVLADMGGWIALCEVPDNEMPFSANKFEKRYQAYSAQDGIPQYPRMLIGISDAYNQREGFKTSPPICIGNLGQCNLVLQHGSDVGGVEVQQFKSMADLSSQVAASIEAPK